MRFGVVLFELLTSRRPFQNTAMLRRARRTQRTERSATDAQSRGAHSRKRTHPGTPARRRPRRDRREVSSERGGASVRRRRHARGSICAVICNRSQSGHARARGCYVLGRFLRRHRLYRWGRGHRGSRVGGRPRGGVRAGSSGRAGARYRETGCGTRGSRSLLRHQSVPGLGFRSMGASRPRRSRCSIAALSAC